MSLTIVEKRKTKRNEKNLFYLLLALLPANLGKHFFLNQAYVGGVLADYLIPTVYLTDIIILLIVTCSFFKRGFSSVAETTKLLLFPVLFFNLSLWISVLASKNGSANIFDLLRILNLSLFSFWISLNINLKKDLSNIIKFLSLGVLWASVLGTLQYVRQTHIFGYWFLGEPVLSPSLPGVAKASFLGVEKLRAYGTFPHPNVFGGYLAVFLPWVAAAALHFRVLTSISFILGVTALFLTFSKTAWAALVLGGASLALLNLKIEIKKILVLAASISLIFILLIYDRLQQVTTGYYQSLLSSLSWIRRVELNEIALKMFKDSPVFGAGWGNFVRRMSEFGKVSGFTAFVQPVHNIYLLVAAQAGAAGLLSFGAVLISSLKNTLANLSFERKLVLAAFIQILFLGFFDHYFLTLPQGLIMFWLVVGLTFAKE